MHYCICQQGRGKSTPPCRGIFFPSLSFEEFVFSPCNYFLCSLWALYPRTPLIPLSIWVGSFRLLLLPSDALYTLSSQTALQVRLVLTLSALCVIPSRFSHYSPPVFQIHNVTLHCLRLSAAYKVLLLHCACRGCQCVSVRLPNLNGVSVSF